MQRAILSATCINLCIPESNLLRRSTGLVSMSGNILIIHGKNGYRGQVKTTFSITRAK
jgi:hypothetical protein